MKVLKSGIMRFHNTETTIVKKIYKIQHLVLEQKLDIIYII